MHGYFSIRNNLENIFRYQHDNLTFISMNNTIFHLMFFVKNFPLKNGLNLQTVVKITIWKFLIVYRDIKWTRGEKCDKICH